MLDFTDNPRRLWLAPLLLLAIAGCQGGDTAVADTETEDEEVLPTPVEVATVSRGDIAAVYTGTATLEAFGEAMVMAKVGGQIEALLVNEGDKVTAGQPVARIDDDRLQLEARRSLASLEKARQQYRRNVELHEKGLLPAGTYEGLKYDLDALIVAYELAQLELSYTTVRAPIDGVVSERLVKTGNTITANAGIFRITDMDPLLAYLYVPEQEFRKLHADQAVSMTVDALPGRTFEGRIQLISPVIDPDTATFKVTAEIPDVTGELKPGMFGRVNVVYDTRIDVPLVPRVALLSSDSDTSVFVIEDGVAKTRDIEVGYTSRGSIEVVAGLSPGEQVVVIGQNGLKPGASVHVIPHGESVAKIKPKKDEE